MLTQGDLKQIRTIIREEGENEVVRAKNRIQSDMAIVETGISTISEGVEEVNKRLTSVSMKVDSMAKKITSLERKTRKIDKDVSALIKRTDREDVLLQKRVSKIETHLGLSI